MKNKITEDTEQTPPKHTPHNVIEEALKEINQNEVNNNNQ